MDSSHTLVSDRTSSLSRLAQVQGAFEASVKDMLEGLDGLWARLEVLHTGVTFTKSGSRGHKDLTSARTEAEVSQHVGLSAVLVIDVMTSPRAARWPSG